MSLLRRCCCWAAAFAMFAVSAVVVVHDAPPALADHEENEIWSATLTVRDLSTVAGRGLGCDTTLDTHLHCTSSLTQNQFDLLGTQPEVTLVELRGAELFFDVARLGALEATTPDGLADYVLFVDGVPLAVADSSTGSAHASWANTDLSWAAGDTVRLSLRLRLRPGDLDPHFGFGGKLTTGFNIVHSRINAMAVQSDGKIVVAGYASNGNDNDFALARYNADGSLDATFGSGGRVLTPFGSSGDEARAVAIDDDGRIVAAGISFDGTNNDFAVARYTTAGALDTDFSSDGKVTTDFNSSNDSAFAVAVYDDYRILAAGRAGDDFGLVRYLADGTLDPNFGTQSGPTRTGKRSYSINSGEDVAKGVVLQDDTKILVGGYTTVTSAGVTHKDFALLRVGGAGNPDSAFASNGMTTTAFGTNLDDEVNAIAIQGDGKILAAGYTATAQDGSDDDVAVARYTTAGALDTSFSSDGKGTYDFNIDSENDDRANAMAIDDVNGGIVLTGQTAGSLGTARIGADGNTVTRKYVTTVYGNDEANAVAVLDDGDILIAGYSTIGTSTDFVLARYDSQLTTGKPHQFLADYFGIAGIVTTSFGGGDDVAHAISVEPSGNILVAGTAASVSGSSQLAMTRYNPRRGLTEREFGINGQLLSPLLVDARALVTTARPNNPTFTDKIYVAGNASGDFAVARFVATSFAQVELDTTFGTNGVVTTDFESGTDQIEAMAVQSDGKIVVAGGATSSGQFVFALARYTAAGVLDTAFGTDGKVTTGLGNGDIANAVAVQSDGKIVVAGYAGASSRTVFALARYTTAGVLDTSFGTGGKVLTAFTGLARASAVAVQSDGKIVVAGYANDDFALARYTTAGVLDTAFGSVGDGKVLTDFEGQTDVIESIAIQNDGKIVAAGAATDAPENLFALARYNADGTLDASFGTGGKVTTSFGFREAGAAAMALQSDGKIVVAGQAPIDGPSRVHTDMAVARYVGQGNLVGDASLSALAVTASTNGVAFNTAASLSPALSAGTTAYTTTVAAGTTHVKVRPTANHASATLRVGLSGGSTAALASGSLSGALAVSDGSAVTVEVTAQNGDARTYTVTVNLAAAVQQPPPVQPPPVQPPPVQPPRVQPPPRPVGPVGPVGGSSGGGGVESDRGSERVAGEDRHATSLAVARRVALRADGRLGVVVVAGGRSWTDALVAGPLAGRLDAAVLLSAAGGLSDDAVGWLGEVGVREVIVVGDAQQIAPDALAALSGVDADIERIAGEDPHAASAAVARRVGQPARLGPVYGRTVIIATSRAFADALAAGPLAAAGPHPILLTDGDTLHPEVAAYLADHADHVIIMGGTAAVSTDVETQIRAIPQANRSSSRPMAVTRLGGADRYATAALFAGWLTSRRLEPHVCFTLDTAGIATGHNHADAAAAAPLLAQRCAPLLLTQPHTLPPVTASFLRRTTTLIIFGGPNAINNTTLTDWNPQ